MSDTVRVMLRLDQSRTYRFADELVEVVEAVRHAEPTDESLSVEWKSTLNLTVSNDLTHIPRAILGFANRDPAEAAREFGGHAYVIVGAEPGSLLGVVPMDFADLVPKVRVYVGGVIHWHPAYVAVDGKQVLVIVVEPPRPGDAIHTLQKQFGSYQAGWIFTRGPGQTVMAGPERVAMLQRRALARADLLDLTVSADPATIEAPPDINSLLDSWSDRERERLKPDLMVVGDHLVHRASDDSVRRMRINPQLADPRSLEEYEQEVERYIDSGRRALAASARKRLHFHEPTQLTLRVVNTTGRHFRGIELSAVIADASALDMAALTDIGILADSMPHPLAAWGDGRRGSGPIYPADMLKAFSTRIPPIIPLEPRYSLTCSPGQLTIDYQQFDLRTEGTWVSPSIPLLIGQAAGDHLQVAWRATADDADGRLSGSVVLDVISSTVELVAEADE